MQLGCCRGPGDSQVPFPLCGGKGIYCQSIQRNALCSGAVPFAASFFPSVSGFSPSLSSAATTCRCLRFIESPMVLSLPADVEYVPAASYDYDNVLRRLYYTECIVNRQFIREAAMMVYRQDVSSSETNMTFTRPFSHRIASSSSWRR